MPYEEKVRLRGQAVAGTTWGESEFPQNGLHAVFDVEFAFLEADFFELFGV
jgi:hypothetical protein